MPDGSCDCGGVRNRGYITDSMGIQKERYLNDKLGFVLLIAVILVQGMLFWKYQRQVKDICRQLSFLMKHDSNMLITREMDFGGIGELADVLNEWLELKRREKKEYLKKEEMISDTYTNLSHDIRTPLTSLDGYFQLMETCEDQEEQRRYMKDHTGENRQPERNAGRIIYFYKT